MSGHVVIVKQGWIRGATVKNFTGESYIAFKGIPYAAPPTGNLRFADPQPPVPWTGIRDALKEGSMCLQMNPKIPGIIGGEDCLYLNVATNSLKGSRPVMVWIHGGAFVYGDGGSSIYSPDYFMKTDVILVTINYRIGVLGFLNLNHEVAPGNMGLKDQVAALKWVKENIAQFGGDPNNVTIFGESAGGASVHYLLLSPLAKGLFHKAIAQSGVALNPWAYLPKAPDFPQRYVAALGKETTDPYEMIDYLRSIPAEKLLEVPEANQNSEDKSRLLFPFRPNIDNKSPQPFMPKPPQELAAEGIDIPIMIGYNSHEGLIFFSEITDERLTSTDENFEITVIHDWINEAPSKLTEISNEIRKHYFGDKRLSMDTLEEFVQCYGDVHFVIGIQNAIEFQKKKKTPTYFYKFCYENPKSFGKFVYNTTMKGTAHADDLSYLFHHTAFGDVLKVQPGTVQETISNRFIRMWTNFAKTGNPTPQIDDLITVKWEPITQETKKCLIIDEQLSLEENPDEKIFQFYKRFYKCFSSQ